MARVVETASLPPEKAKLFFSDWLIVCRSGYIAGVSDQKTAKGMARRMTKAGH